MAQKSLALIVGKLSYLFAFVIVNLNVMKRSPAVYFFMDPPRYSETGPCAPYFFRLMVTLSIVPVNSLLARV